MTWATYHYTVAASLRGSLIGSPWNSQAVVYLFQKTFTLLGEHSQFQSLQTYWEQTESTSWCMHTLPSYQLASSNLARNEVTTTHIQVSWCLSTSPSHKYNLSFTHRYRQFLKHIRGPFLWLLCNQKFPTSSYHISSVLHTCLQCQGKCLKFCYYQLYYVKLTK